MKFWPGLWQSVIAIVWLAASCVAGGANAAGGTNVQGLWWAAGEAEPGWGISFAHQGDIVFATWFTFDVQGKPWWLFAELHPVSPDVYSGAIGTASGPPFNAVPFAPAPVETTVGTMTASFSDAAHGSLNYAVAGVTQSKSIVPQVFAAPPLVCNWGVVPNLAAATNYTDLWWNANEPGWGLSISHQGDIVFAVWFTYDAQGKPWWLVARLAKTAAGVYDGPVYAVVGPGFGTVPWDPSRVIETQVGNATAKFTDGNSGLFSYAVNGVAQSKSITRQVFAPPGTVCSGEVSYTLQFVPGSDYMMYVKIGSGEPHQVQLDTGSLGLFVPSRVVGATATIRDTEACSITYVSSGTILKGHRVIAPVELLGSSSAGGVKPLPTTVPMPVCAIDEAGFDGGMMGVGFGRPNSDPALNVLLQVAEARSGAMRPGYVLSTHPVPSVQIGITTPQTATFKTVQLAPNPSGNGDWLASSLVGCAALWSNPPSPPAPASWRQCGGMLVDTGVPEMILWGPTDTTLGGIVPSNGGSVPVGKVVNVTTPPGSGLDYAFTLGSGANTPSAINVRSAATFSINTGRALLVDYDYLFDAAGGRVGFLKH